MERVVSVDCGVVGVVLWCGVLASNFYAIFVSILASKCTTIRPRSRRDRAVIGGPWSWSWSWFARPPNEWKEFHAEGAPIAARSRHDRGSIGPRSWSSSIGLPCRPMKIRSRGTRCYPHARSRPSDEDPPVKIAPRASPFCKQSQPFDASQALRFDADREVLGLPCGVR